MTKASTASQHTDAAAPAGQITFEPNRDGEPFGEGPYTIFVDGIPVAADIPLDYINERLECEHTARAQRHLVVQGLRELADFLESEPRSPLPDESSLRLDPWVGYERDARAELLAYATLLGDDAREAQEHGSVYVYREFSGGVQLALATRVSRIGREVPAHHEYDPILPATTGEVSA